MKCVCVCVCVCVEPLRSLVALIEAVFPFPPSPSLPSMLDSRDWIP